MLRIIVHGVCATAAVSWNLQSSNFIFLLSTLYSSDSYLEQTQWKTGSMYNIPRDGTQQYFVSKNVQNLISFNSYFLPTTLFKLIP